MLSIFKAIRIALYLFLINRKQARKALASFAFPKSVGKKKQVVFYGQMSIQVIRWANRFIGQNAENSLNNGVLLGTFAALTDELSDDLNIAPTQILSVLLEGNPDKKMEICQQVYNEILNQEGIDKERFFAHGKLACKAQEASLKQMNGSALSEMELREITCQKGGLATQWYVCLFPAAQGLESFLYDTGVFLQLNNDLFDIYKDRENGQQTLFTNAGNFTLLRELYEKALQRCVSACGNKATQSELHLLAAIGYVYFDQLIELQAKHGPGFTVYQVSRKELVCDMERLENRIKAIRYFIDLEKASA